MNLSNLLFGTIMLLAGRKFFWLFVGMVGFLVGMDYTALLFQDAPAYMVILVSLAMGILGALIVIFAQWMAVIMAGFIGGGYLFLLVVQLFMPLPETLGVIFLVGGIIGAMVMMITFDLALICLSSLLGAALIVGAMGFIEPMISSLIFLILAVIGMYVQNIFLNTGNPPPNANVRA